VNPVGLTSLAYARPFTAAQLPLLNGLRAAGLDFVDVPVPEPAELSRSERRRALDDAGLGIALAARMSAARDPTAEDAGARKTGRENLKRCVDVAVALGARSVGGPLYGALIAGRVPQSLDEDRRKARLKWAAGALAEAGAYAALLDVVLAVAPLNRFETDMVNTARHAVEVIELARAPGLGVLLDTFHMNIEEEDLARGIRAAGKRLVHFHAGESHRGHLGSGHVDWATVAHALASVGYAGPITLTPLRRDDERIGVPLAQWRPPACDEDPEIARSAATLRKFLQAASR
jgi:D-psicose/D-tagatose/L-ribulose 3-epimerase